MKTIMKCKCQFLGNCRYVRKLHAAIYKLEDEYPSITEFDKIIVVQSRKSFWNDQLPDAGDLFMVSCGLLKSASFDHLQWILTRIYFNLEMNEYDEIEDDDECSGDCQNSNVACGDCRCGESCCGPCRGEDEEDDGEEGDDEEEDDDDDEEEENDDNEENDNTEDEYSNENNLTRAMMRLESVREIKYPIEIVVDDEINAYALPEGKIQITSAAVENLSEAELAFLIGHEEVHIDKQHSQAKKNFAELCIEGLKQISENEKMGDFKKVVSIVAVGAAAVVAMPLVDKIFELDSDLKAKERMVEAGYPEEDATKFFDRLGSRRGKYFSTHPTPQFRKKRLDK